MKRMISMIAVLAAMLFSSCSQEVGGSDPDPQQAGYAYLSIRVEAQQQSYAGSGEENALPAENALKKLYLITFDGAGNIVGVPGGGHFSMIDVSALSETAAKAPEAVKISSRSKHLVVVANPGPELLRAITPGLSGTSNFASFNAAVANISTADIVSAEGFAMITGGSEEGKVVGDRIPYPFVVIEKIQIVNGTGTEADAKAKAEAEKPENRLRVKLERLAAKLVVRENPDGVEVKKPDAKFTLRDWTVDALNSTYFPFAEKTLIAATHTAGDYTNNFYTQDPNFIGTTGLRYATVNAAAPAYSYAPVLPFTDATYPNGYYGWKPVEAVAYAVENTMAAAEQKYGNATRIVMRATYFPKDVSSGDWFQWANTDYKSLAELKQAYADASASGAFKAACDAFYAKIKAYYTATSQALAATDFAALQPADLSVSKVPNGGEVVKDGSNAVIRWYQEGACYYYYEIRHDNDPAAAGMAFAKYGIVRNNWYNLTLNSVAGPGTPWYPDVDKPGPGDPDPEDPIDDQASYLGISVDVAKWIFWDTGMDIF